jgi:hypothetical protein
MRFAAVIRIAQPQSVRAPVPDFVRRIMSGELRSSAPSTPVLPAEVPVPADLDQRVRLVGEW